MFSGCNAGDNCELDYRIKCGFNESLIILLSVF